MAKVRNSAKALVIREGKILLQLNRDKMGPYWLLPGGGQKHGETLHEALKREVKEETGIEVEVGQLRYVREYIGANHEFAKIDSERHQVEFMFECRAKEGSEISQPEEPDENQLQVEWIDIKKLSDYAVYPSVLKKIVTVNGLKKAGVYLGDVN